MRFLKPVIPVLAFVALVAAQWARADGCSDRVPALCTISTSCDSNSYAYYQLSIPSETIDSINVDAGATDCEVTTDKATTDAAHLKLVSQAQQLKAAGICVLIIDNID